MERPYRWLGYSWIPGAFVLGALALTVNLLAGSAGSLDDWIVTDTRGGCRFTGGGRGEPPTRKS